MNGMQILTPGQISNPVELSNADMGSLFREAGGALILKDFELSLEQFKTISDKLMADAWSHYSPRRKKLANDKTVIEALTGNQKVYLHSEFAYIPFRPDVIFFFCQTPATVDGQTTFCSTRNFIDGLSDKTKKMICERPVVYSHKWPVEFFKFILNAESDEDALIKVKAYESVKIGKIEDGQVSFTYTTTPFSLSSRSCFILSPEHLGDANPYAKTLMSATWLDGEPIQTSLLREFQEVEHKHVQKVEWGRGDMIALDNYQFMHGRESFSGPREIFTRFGVAR